MQAALSVNLTMEEMIRETRQRFQTVNGRLLTEEEAVQLTDKIRSEIRDGESHDED